MLSHSVVNSRHHFLVIRPAEGGRVLWFDAETAVSSAGRR
jgi:hypothetical protein